MSAKNRTALKTGIDDNYPDNSTGLIAPLNDRTQHIDEVDSALNLKETTIQGVTGLVNFAGGLQINGVDAVLPNIDFINQESDFPTQDGGTITLTGKTQHIITSDFSTAKNIICLDGSSWTSGSIDGAKVIFTGTGAMFSGTNASFYIHETAIDPGITNEAFNFVDNAGHTSKFIAILTQADNCLRWGTFEGMLLAQTLNSNSPNAEDGAVFVGNDGIIFSFDRFALTSTNAGFKGIDLGSSTATIIEYNNLFFSAPSGAVGISGLANSGNVPAGRLAMVSNSEFLGGMTALENITNEDVRWNFKDNFPTPDTIVDGMASLTGNTTETAITTVNTPVLVVGTFVCERQSLMSCTTAGRLTLTSERDIVLPIDIAVTVKAASGTNKDITIYLALNGTVIANSAKSNRVGSSDPRNTSVLWQLNLSTTDFLEIFIENNSDTINLVVTDAILRAR